MTNEKGSQATNLVLLGGMQAPEHRMNLISEPPANNYFHLVWTESQFIGCLLYTSPSPRD